jgi:hypothetical protein
LTGTSANFSGNVGIGTPSPSAKLDVTDTSAGSLVNNITVQNASNTTSTEAGIFFAPTIATGNIRGARITGIQEDGNNAIGLKFYTGLGATISERMRITSSGNVGIGTTSPNSPLDVNGITYLRSDLRLGTNYSGSNTAIIKWQSSTATNANSLGLFTWGDEKDIQIGGNNVIFGSEVGTERMRITSGGNVGIGTTSPATRLDVNGAITASGGFFNSDIRLKEIVDYDYNVSDIKPITYLWKDERDDKKHVGYSAQEVQKVMPDAVNEAEDGMLSVNYIEVLVAKIAKLENKIKQIEKLCPGTI